MSRHVAFLIGSGASIPLGMPSMNALDSFIMSDNDAHFHSDQHFYIDPSRKDQCCYSQNKPSTIRSYLHHIKNKVQQYYNHIGIEHQITYEDLYDYLYQFKNIVDSEYENPIMDLDTLSTVTRYRVASESYRDRRKIIGEALTYIAEMVIHKLMSRIPVEDVANLYSKLLLLEHQDIQKHVFTLNHDLIIDQYLEAQKVDFEDGFVLREGNHCFNAARLYSSTANVKYVKLHGSINYYSCGERVIKTMDRNRAPNGDNVFGNAYLNIGRISKIISYNSFFFHDLATYFSYVLTSVANTLIIVGYGFNDKGLNNILASWYNQDQNKVIVVIHPNPDDLINRARGALQRVLSSERVVFIKKGFEELDNEICSIAASCG